MQWYLENRTGALHSWEDDCGGHWDPQGPWQIEAGCDHLSFQDITSREHIYYMYIICISYNTFCFSCVWLACYLSHRLGTFQWVWGGQNRWNFPTCRQTLAWLLRPSKSTQVQDSCFVWLMGLGLFPHNNQVLILANSGDSCNPKTGGWKRTSNSFLGFLLEGFVVLLGKSCWAVLVLLMLRACVSCCQGKVHTAYRPSVKTSLFPSVLPHSPKSHLSILNSRLFHTDLTLIQGCETWK